MRLAFFGDVVGKSGRDGISDHLPGLRRDLRLDFVVVNAENAAGGFGITENSARQLFDAGADCLTLGNHSWDQREALTYIVREPRLLRPANYPHLMDAPGRGADVFTLDDGRRVLVPETEMAHYRAGRTVRFSCDGCAPGQAEIVWVSARPEFTPPVLYSRNNRDRLVYRVEARPTNPAQLNPGLPVDVEPLDSAQ